MLLDSKQAFFSHCIGIIVLNLNQNTTDESVRDDLLSINLVAYIF